MAARANTVPGICIILFCALINSLRVAISLRLATVVLAVVRCHFTTGYTLHVSTDAELIKRIR